MATTSFNTGMITAAITLVIILIIWIIYISTSNKNGYSLLDNNQKRRALALQRWTELVNYSRLTGIPISREDAYGFMSTPLQRSFNSNRNAKGLINTRTSNITTVHLGTASQLRTADASPHLTLNSCNGCSPSCWNPPSGQSSAPYMSQQSIKIANFVVGNVPNSTFTFYGIAATLTSNSGDTTVQFQIALVNNPGTEFPVNQITVGVSGVQGSGNIPALTTTDFKNIQTAVNDYFPDMYVCPPFLGSLSDPDAAPLASQFSKYKNLRTNVSVKDNTLNIMLPSLFPSPVISTSNYTAVGTMWTAPLLSTEMMYEYCCILFVGDIASIAASGGGQVPECTDNSNSNGCNPKTGVAVLLVRDYDIESNIFCSNLQPPGSTACPNSQPAYMKYNDSTMYPKFSTEKGIYYMIAASNIVLSDQNNETLLDLDRWGFCNNYPTSGSVDGGGPKSIPLVRVSTA